MSEQSDSGVSDVAVHVRLRHRHCERERGNPRLIPFLIINIPHLIPRKNNHKLSFLLDRRLLEYD